jgi:hypothetical protein
MNIIIFDRNHKYLSERACTLLRDDLGGCGYL